MANETSKMKPKGQSMMLGLGGAGVIAICLCLAAAVGIGAYFFLNRGAAAAVEPTVEYILDVSPRMNLAVEDGQGTRLAAAQAVLAEIVRPAHPSITAGFRVFGSGAAAQSCQDTNLIVPLARSNQTTIADSVLAVQPGASPEAAMAEAMIAAIKDMARTRGPHTLVVVTGGADSCNAQAASLIAQEAQRAGVDLQQFVIGFQVSEAEAQAIKAMMASSAGATYYDAPDSGSLRDLLQTIQQTVTAQLNQAVAAATSGGATATPSDGYQSQTACDHPYFPLRAGATWTYNVSGSGATSNFIWTVDSVSGDLNNATASVSFAIEGFTATYDWVCTPEGVTYFSFGAADTGATDFTATFKVTNQSGASILAFDKFESGATWDSAYTMEYVWQGSGMSGSSTSNTSETHSAGPVQSLSTSLGTFDVIPVTTSTSTTTTASVAGQSISTSSSSTSVNYFAKGIGLIRGESSGEGYSSTTELVSYSVPK